MSQSILRMGARLALGALLFVAIPLFGQSTTPSLVKDLAYGSADGNPTALMKSDTTLFFSTWNVGRYYRSDGTSEGTSVISDVSFADSRWVYFNNQVYFVGHDGYGWELWRVNAAGDGTEMVKDISTDVNGSDPRYLQVALGRIFFSALDDTAGRELWTSDGTFSGTVLVADLRSNGSSDPRYFTEFGGWVYFVADDDSGAPRLWRTDGTAANTSQFGGVTIGKLSYDAPLLIAHGGFLYFSASTAGGTELWKTDGTNVSLVADLQPGGSSYPHQAVAVGNRLYFAAVTSALGDELYVIPAPGQSPVLVADIVPGTASSYPFMLSPLGDTLLLSAGNRIWKADGTTLTQVLDTPSSEAARVGRFVYFTTSRPASGYELWVTDGTAAGTHLVSDLVYGTASSYPGGLTPLGDRLYFAATTPSTGKELWRIDTCDATITPSGPTTFCNPGSVTLTASPGYSYLWSTGQTTQSIVVTSSGSYSVTVLHPNGCSVTSQPLVVTVSSPTATITPSGPTTFCEGGSVTLTASAGSSYLWSTGATTQSIVVNTTGNYSVTVTNANGCSATSAPTSVTVNPLPTATITPSGATTFCEGGSVTLTASAASSYLWSTGATTQSIVVNATGNYSVTVTNANGCSATSAPTSVTVNPLPTATITPSGPTTFCEGGSVTLTASAGSSYLWSTGATTQSIVVNATGNYSVTVTNANGCSATSAPTSVTVNPLPTATITPSGATTFCEGGNVTLTASPASSYLWSTGATTQSIVVNATGNYSVTVTNANGCSATSAPTSVTVNPLPSATITPSGPTTFCEGGSVTLTASAASSYLWSTGATTQSIVVNATGNYSVTVTNANGCSATSAPTSVTVNPLPTATITPSGPTTFCEGGSVTLTASPASSYLWSTGATTQSIVVNTTGNYSVTVTNANGCSATSAPTSVTVNANPATPVITPSGPTTFCQGGSVTLSVPAGYSYLWSTGATTQSIAVTATGNYSVTVTNASGCSASSAATAVTVTPATAISQQPQSQTIPKNTAANLSVVATGTGTLTYQWYRGTSGNTSNPIGGATTSSYNTGRLTKGTYPYWVRVTGSCGTVDSNTATITAQ